MADELCTIQNVEIFSTGKWNGHDITQKDLEHIKEAFDANAKTVKPALRFGHESQAGLPAAGIVANLKIVGKKLVADFVDMPKKVFDMIQKRAYRKVSCEIYRNVDIDGKKYPKLLGAVALLGAELPGVLNLKDILDSNLEALGFASADSRIILTIENPNHDDQGNPMSDANDNTESAQVLKFKLEQAEKDNADLKAKLDENKSAMDAFNQRLESLETEKKATADKLAEAQASAKAAQVDKFVTELKSEKLCTPAMVDGVKALLDDSGKATFSFGDKKDITRQAVLKDVLKMAKEAGDVNFEEVTADADEGDAKSETAAVEAYAQQHKISFAAAYKALSREKNVKLRTQA